MGEGQCRGGGSGDRAPTLACPPHRSPPPTQLPWDAAHHEAFQDARIAGHRLAVDAPGRVFVWGSGAHTQIRTTAAPWGKAVPCREEVYWGGATPPASARGALGATYAPDAPAAHGDGLDGVRPAVPVLLRGCAGVHLLSAAPPHLCPAGQAYRRPHAGAPGGRAAGRCAAEPLSPWRPQHVVSAAHESRSPSEPVCACPHGVSGTSRSPQHSALGAARTIGGVLV
jgi:hypothetical protein